MKRSTKSWIMTFLAAFLATVLGIVLTFGIENHKNSKKREEISQMLAKQITQNMEEVNLQINSYIDIYHKIDSTYKCVHKAIKADSLDSVKKEVIDTLLLYSLSEFAQLKVDNRLNTYKMEILNTIGEVDLIGHIDDFYVLAQQYVETSTLVIEQKQKVVDKVYTEFDFLDEKIKGRDLAIYLDELPEFKIFIGRMQEVLSILTEIERQIKEQLKACKLILETFDEENK